MGGGDDSSSLSDVEVSFIVIGSVIAMVLIVYGIWHFMFRGKTIGIIENGWAIKSPTKLTNNLLDVGDVDPTETDLHDKRLKFQKPLGHDEGPAEGDPDKRGDNDEDISMF